MTNNASRILPKRKKSERVGLTCSELKQWAQPAVVPASESKRRFEDRQAYTITTRKCRGRVDIACLADDKIAGVIRTAFITKAAL